MENYVKMASLFNCGMTRQLNMSTKRFGPRELCVPISSPRRQIQQDNAPLTLVQSKRNISAEFGDRSSPYNIGQAHNWLRWFVCGIRMELSKPALELFKNI